ncbi:hypothetical protein N8I77_004765 [Diaporthe amygdali]|uniref:Uncharacterized protein n=1 Tax=Phomopsis amygdali TaxID=1214568 RepID=A0AAD9W8Y6_PHOAM|nr:hypothetical protein N8I77_004765 [Diaporthe amygdali]
MTKGQGEEILAAYTRILAPLVPLGSDGLARFYACLMWPWKYTDETMDTCVIKGWEWVEAHERVMKDHAERLVMGDRYHSLFDGDGWPFAEIEPKYQKDPFSLPSRSATAQVYQKSGKPEKVFYWQLAGFRPKITGLRSRGLATPAIV